jgi:hypothetical protein
MRVGVGTFGPAARRTLVFAVVIALAVTVGEPHSAPDPNRAGFPLSWLTDLLGPPAAGGGAAVASHAAAAGRYGRGPFALCRVERHEGWWRQW